jgi:2,4-dienoyl-CoA reductase-like NADH-dependent reductase (Old Yellow Enzyme family)
MIDVAPLFTPFTIKGMTLPNRFVMPAMQRGWSEAGRPTRRMVEYYRERAAGGVSLIIGESAAVDHPASSDQPSASYLFGDALDGWGECIEAVHQAGGRMFCQLWHEGAVRKPIERGGRVIPSVSPSGIVQKGVENGVAATAKDLEEIREAFVRSALSAKKIGADGIELHCAHGFLLDLFLWAESNVRTDGYGGADIRHRARFIVELVEAVRKAVGPDFPISLRFSQFKEVDFEARIVDTIEELKILTGLLRKAGVDIFHPSTRRFWLPGMPGSDRTLAGLVKSVTDAAVIAVGSVGLDRDVFANHFGEDAETSGEGGVRQLMDCFNRGDFDLIAVGRAIIGDAQWVQKLREGRYDEMRRFTKEDFAGDIVWDSSFTADAHGQVNSFPAA